MIAENGNPREIQMLPYCDRRGLTKARRSQSASPIAIHAAPARSKRETFVALHETTGQTVYQRKPLRCSSAISFTMASVCGRRYWAQAARMALTNATGAAYEAPKVVDSTEARKTSSHSRASGDT